MTSELATVHADENIQVNLSFKSIAKQQVQCRILIIMSRLKPPKLSKTGCGYEYSSLGKKVHFIMLITLDNKLWNH